MPRVTRSVVSMLLAMELWGPGKSLHKRVPIMQKKSLPQGPPHMPRLQRVEDGDFPGARRVNLGFGKAG